MVEDSVAVNAMVLWRYGHVTSEDNNSSDPPVGTFFTTGLSACGSAAPPLGPLLQSYTHTLMSVYSVCVWR